jgi:hypothetical protein
VQRVRLQWHAEAIGAAFDLLPGRLVERLDGTHFLTGTDPVFAGLHGFEESNDGRSYRSTAHVTHLFHQRHLPAAHRAVTVVLPSPDAFERRVIVHELGHVLHWQFGHGLDWRQRFAHEAVPVTDYARTDRYEAFAEAFAAWALPYGHGMGAAKDRLYEQDPATVALFAELAT